MIGARVTGTWDPTSVVRDVERRARRSVDRAAHAGAGVARGVARQRVDTGETSQIHVTEVLPLDKGRGWVAYFYSSVKNAWYQNDGTLGNRRRDKRKRTPKSPRDTGPGSGVTPLLFLDAGLRAGRRVLVRSSGAVPRG